MSVKIIVRFTPLFIFSRFLMFVGRRRDTAGRCLVFVLVSRRVSNLNKPEKILNMSLSVTIDWKNILGLYFHV